jgi:hypothetical protein
MSDELLAEIRRLKAENKKLTDGLSELSGELKEVRGEARDRRHEARTLAQQLAEVAADRDQWKTKVETDPEGWQARVDELRGTVRSLRHERCYEAVARQLKVSDPTKLADLLKLSGHAPEADEPDEAQISETFRAALQGRPWLVDDEAGASTQAPGGANANADAAGIPAEPGGRPGPGADRGQSLSSTTGPARSKVPGRL